MVRPIARSTHATIPIVLVARPPPVQRRSFVAWVEREKTEARKPPLTARNPRCINCNGAGCINCNDAGYINCNGAEYLNGIGAGYFYCNGAAYLNCIAARCLTSSGAGLRSRVTRACHCLNGQANCALHPRYAIRPISGDQRRRYWRPCSIFRTFEAPHSRRKSATRASDDWTNPIVTYAREGSAVLAQPAQRQKNTSRRNRQRPPTPPRIKSARQAA